MGLRSPGEAVTTPAERIAASLTETRAKARRMIDELPAVPTAENLTLDHPYSRAFGFEETKRLLDPPLPIHVRAAAAQRELVRKLSLEGRKVRIIAGLLNCHCGTVVKMRRRLRDEGKLPPL